jgi:hypothetical protein
MNNSDLFAILFVGFFALIYLLIIVALYVVNSYFMMRLFKKAHVEAWKAWVPVVNIWKFLELGGYQGALSLLIIGALIPLLGLVATVILVVFECMAAYQIGLKLRKESVWVVLYVFASTIWLGIVGLDRSVWDDSLGKPALGIEKPPTSGYYTQYPGTNYPA